MCRAILCTSCSASGELMSAERVAAETAVMFYLWSFSCHSRDFNQSITAEMFQLTSSIKTPEIKNHQQTQQTTRPLHGQPSAAAERTTSSWSTFQREVQEWFHFSFSLSPGSGSSHLNKEVDPEQEADLTWDMMNTSQAAEPTLKYGPIHLNLPDYTVLCSAG